MGRPIFFCITVHNHIMTSGLCTCIMNTIHFVTKNKGKTQSPHCRSYPHNHHCWTIPIGLVDIFNQYGSKDPFRKTFPDIISNLNSESYMYVSTSTCKNKVWRSKKFLSVQILKEIIYFAFYSLFKTDAL